MKIAQHMYERDDFSRWLGIEILEAEKGYAVLRMKIRKEFTNGFGIAHGAIAFAIADSALAFAINEYGRQAYTIDTYISYVNPVGEGDELIATAREIHLHYKVARLEVTVVNQNQAIIAKLTSTVYRKNKEWKIK